MSRLCACLVCGLLLLGFAKARMAPPAGLETVEPYAVDGHNPRTWNRPIGFGPWRSIEVREGWSKSWSIEAFGLGAGTTKLPVHLLLEGPDGARREVACLTRGLEAWRGSLRVDLSRFMAPRLACVIRRGEDTPPSVSLVLERRGVKLAGSLERDDASYDIASVHRFAGSSIASSEPVGYAITHRGDTAAAVETLNRGRVWLAPAGDETLNADLAAAAAALLLFRDED